MNERIKTMWVEATGSVWPRPYKFTAGEYDTHLAKFAELIVRECMEQVYYTREDKIDDTISQNIKSRMSEHFGVE